MNNVLRHLTIDCITAFGNNLCQCDIVHKFMDNAAWIQIIHVYDKQNQGSKP